MSSLVLIARLDGMGLAGQEGLFFNPARGRIDDLGFSSGLDQALSQRPSRPESVPYDNWCQDRFFAVRPNEDNNSTGSVKVAEALVYDFRMHGEIDFTGLSVTVSLQKEAYQTYLDYVGTMRMGATSNSDAWDGRILFRIPSDPFAFPMPRGSSSPWGDMRNPTVSPLKLIKQFAFDEIDIQPLRDAQGRRVQFDETASEGRAGWQTALSLRA
ncbi:hypothetical protein [Bradyrhizobium sp. BR13661]|uniref:hypothetical protein n=1 Tax=Bradyrhizobium sp. BR13661 TaxID=2940622 RepID=UPI00247518C9|nr:hypothetical protein [Bradyrhizobium sp. BR13661]MDH6256313.1 hypothetical protein [Bradyrhizobium sp. BR13661]